ncbi:hypothetical protein GGS24DRAFT_500791 [Hypoxylon argillaceum]|nr:hypothetical protein GGS24DRAFT_500791 [Hypoxylon argillaceum]
MGPFALSIPGYRLGVHSHKLHEQRHHDATQLETESRSRVDSDTETQFSSTPRLPSESINPLSHSPDTLHQLAVAGLSPEDELPSRTHPGFPHKPLPPTKSSRKTRNARAPSPESAGYESDGGGGRSEVGTDSTIASRRGGRAYAVDAKQHAAGVRHLNTMTAIMHRCLRDGDMSRAKRAFGLLVRTRDVDVRVDNLWVLGSEILMRDGEVEEAPKGAMSRSKKPASLSSSPLSSPPSPGLSQGQPYAWSDSGTDSDSDIAEAGQGKEEGDKKTPGPPQRWGSAANLAQVKVYLETLAQQHPHDPHRPHLTSAADFWPALFGIEVYNLDAEFQHSLHQIYAEHGLPSLPSRSPSPDPEHNNYGDPMDFDDDDNEAGYSVASGLGSGEAGGGRQRRGQEEAHDRGRHAAADALRAETQRGALEIAARMDGVMETVPYNTHAELLRLRAHVALFVADLHLPSRVVERYAVRGSSSGSAKQGVSLREAERRLRAHVKGPDEHVALARRGEEQARAVAFFRRVVAAKERLEEWVVRLLDDEEEEEEHGGRLRRSGW